jgi:hypothetical protein
MFLRATVILLLIFACESIAAQQPAASPASADSMLSPLRGVGGGLPARYLETVSSKADKYYNSITSKTEKTLEKLSKWEGKIKTILEKASPETAQRLFGNGQLTFAGLLQQYKEGKVVADGYYSCYDEYRDKLITTVKYLDEKRGLLDSTLITPLQRAKQTTAKLNDQLKNTEATAQWIKERKKQLLQQAVQYIGKSKYLQKIAREHYYYLETLQNYREIFSDQKKAEEAVVKLLQRIPAFNEFFRRNSMLASLFPMPGGASGGQGTQSGFAGLQTRTQVTNFLQQTSITASANSSVLQRNIQDVQEQVTQLRNKMQQLTGGNGGDIEMPGFKPNNQKAKSFFQRFEYGANIQSQKGTRFFPASSSDIGLSAGYKLNDRSLLGIGVSYKIGLGNGWNNIKITSQGLGLRSFIDWKIKNELWISGGYEQNYMAAFKNVEELKNINAWQQSGLIGITKIISLKTKILKKTKLQLLWDFLSYQQQPRSKSLIFRIGYNF